jgi:two-component system sensor histidine kinase/response regulator
MSTEVRSPFPVKKLKGIDVDKGLYRVGGNGQAYIRLLLKFARNQAGQSGEIRQAATRGEYRTVKKLAHRLKGVAANVAAERLQGAAQRLEEVCTADEQYPFENLEKKLQQVELELNQVISSIRTLESAAIEGLPAPSGRKVDPSFIKPLLQQLENLLEQADTEAATVLEKLSFCLQNSELGEQYSRLTVQISQYEFEEALETLKELRLHIFG